jgi:hypothetical protein
MLTCFIESLFIGRQKQKKKKKKKKQKTKQNKNTNKAEFKANIHFENLINK